jgi:hypothetical protein
VLDLPQERIEPGGEGRLFLGPMYNGINLTDILPPFKIKEGGIFL